MALWLAANGCSSGGENRHQSMAKSSDEYASEFSGTGAKNISLDNYVSHSL